MDLNHTQSEKQRYEKCLWPETTALVIAAGSIEELFKIA